MFSSSYALYVLLFNSKLCFNLVSGFNIIKFLGVNESVSINRRGVLKPEGRGQGNQCPRDSQCLPLHIGRVHGPFLNFKHQL